MNRLNTVNKQDTKSGSTDNLSQMSNSNNDENYQYINQETAYRYTFRINDQYRAWTLDKRHRRTVHKQTLTLHAAYQWELQWRISMEFK